MKKTGLRSWTLLFLAALCAVGCSVFDSFDDDKIPSGVMFYTDCPIIFYFVDENGLDLVDVDQPSTFPLAFWHEAVREDREQALISMQTFNREGIAYYLYNNGSNWLQEDSEMQRCGFQSFLWGRTLEPSYKMFVYAGSEAAADSLRVSFQYLTPAENQLRGGSSWGVDVTSVTYNGVEVFQGNENGKVFVIKPSQGETAVKVGSL